MQIFKKSSQVIALAAILVLAVVSLGLAQAVPVAHGTPDSTLSDSFIVIIKTMQVSTDGGTSWVNVWTTDKQLDIASADIGAKAGEFASNINLAAGNYNAFKQTVSQVFQLKGVVHLAAPSGSLAAGYYYTRAIGTCGFAATEALARAAGDFGTATVNLPSGDFVEQDSLSISVANGGTTYFQVNFNLKNKLALYEVGPGIAAIYPASFGDGDIVISY